LPQNNKIRAFIALPVSNEIQNNIKNLQNNLRQRGISLRWVPPSNVHFTLKFLGNIDPSLVEPIGEGLREIADKTKPFDIDIGGLGAFPNLHSPRVFWVGLRAGTGSLLYLSVEISSLIKQFPTEADNKEFRPHLTLGRSKDRKPNRLYIPESLIQASLGTIICDRIILMQSTLAHNESRYTPLIESVLQGTQT